MFFYFQIAGIDSHKVIGMCMGFCFLFCLFLNKQTKKPLSFYYLFFGLKTNLKKILGPELVKRFLLAHVEALRRVPGLEDSYFIFIPEANLGVTATTLWSYLKGSRFVEVLTELPHDQPGVLTTCKTKCESVDRLRRYLSTNAIFFHKHIVVANPFITDKATQVSSTTTKFLTQLQRFSQVFFQGEDPRSNAEVTYSGAVTANGKLSKTQRDDLCMAMLIATKWGEDFLCNNCNSLTPEELLNQTHLASGMQVQ